MMLILNRPWTLFAVSTLALLIPLATALSAEEIPPKLSLASATSQSGTPTATAEEPVDTTSTESDAETQAALPAASESKPFNFWTSKQMTGDWGGIRTQLEDIGITFALTYQQQYMVNMRGGLETKNGSDFGGSYDHTLELDFGKMKLIPGGSFFFRTKGTYGNEISDFDQEKIGALSRTNGDAGPEEPIFVDKWWYRQRLFDDRLEFRLGKIATAKDLFDVSTIAGSEDKQFLNQALTVNRAIAHRNGLGIYVNAWPTDWLYARAAVVDAQARPRRTGFDTAFHGPARFSVFYELGLLPHHISSDWNLTGNYRIGSWYNPATRTIFRDTLGGALSQRTRTGDVGFYVGFDQMVWKESSDPKDKQGLSLFGRYGYAHGDVNRVEHFWSTGTQYAGLIPTRDKDTLGFAVAQSIMSKQFRSQINARADRETVYELYYACHVTPWFVISPDLQVVTNPGGDKDDRDTLVAGLRLRITF